ncbi:arginine transporter [Aestuariibius sp. HNIBRBA575]|uniref:arginine transporter n=1 Tax=Aestuariibius sp. HNIBRBA575 TaxID=3233343 RepID=UPI0034A36D9A
MRICIALIAALTLTACGSGGRVSGPSGPISQACLAANRDAANRQLCSCVQQAANQTLSSSEQARAATFFETPDLAQAARTADGRSAERFWQRYRNFSDTARGMCS